MILIAAEILHGVVRAIAVVPFVGEFRSNQIGVFSGSLVILVIAYLTIRWIGAKRVFELLLVGFIRLVLTLAIKILFGRNRIPSTVPKNVASATPVATAPA